MAIIFRRVALISFYRYRQYLYMGLVFFLGSAIFIGCLKYQGYFYSQPHHKYPFEKQLREGDARLAPLAQKRYKFCGHIERTALPPEIEKIGAQDWCATAVKPPEGWLTELLPGGEFIFTQELASLCRACGLKRHLGEHEGWVAVFSGPAGSSGPLERVTSLKVAWLPSSWRERILSGAAEFGNEVEMLQDTAPGSPADTSEVTQRYRNH
jgi:hypothetical protein